MEAALPAINSASMPKRCLTTSLNVLSQLGAGGNGNNDLSFLLGGFNDLVPFALCRLPGLGPRNIAAQDRARDENEKKQ